MNTALDVVDLTDGVTSLREAVFFTNTLIGHDTIQFDAALNGQTIQLLLGELAISDSLSINGPGAGLLTIDASGNDPTPDVDSGDGSRIFNIDDGEILNLIDVSISGLTLTGGDTSGSGGAIINHESLALADVVVAENSAAGTGGGIDSSSLGSLSIVRSTVRGNRAANGGGISSSGVNLSIADSTLSGNTVSGQGGGLFSQNTALAVTNSTFSGNTAGGGGGGIYSRPLEAGAAQILHSTIANNRAASGGGISVGAQSDATLLDHTIVAGNTRTPDVRSDIFGAATARYSLIGFYSDATIVDNGGNQIGTSISPIDPRLGPLADNGGPTFTHALLLTSPAIDAGDPAATAGASVPLNDQRGAPFARVQNGRGNGAQIDIGAYEVQSGEIHGHKWNDLDGDGVWDQPDEPGLAGWLIYLDANSNAALDSGEAWTFTDALGGYSFTGVAPGNHLVGEVMRPGWTQTSPGGPDPTSLIVNGDFERGDFTGWIRQPPTTATWVINNGTVDPPSPDGPLPPYAGAFSAMTNAGAGTRLLYQDVTIPAGSQLTLEWVDRIRNHAASFQDPNQEYRVEIRNTANQVLATVFSTNPGDPLLREWTERSADLSAFAGETIRIAFVEQDNLFFFNVHVDNVQIVRGSGVGGIAVAIGDGEVVSDIDFGNWIEPPAEIRGAKWNDLNGDGDWDRKTEPGIEGWTIYLDANNNGALDSGERSTTTGPDGSYSFTNLPAGDYMVAELMQPGWTPTSPAPLDTSSLIVNGGFESGTLAGWTSQNIGSAPFIINNGTVDPIGTDGPLPPYSGAFSALSSATGTNAIYQDVAIPTGSRLILRWADRIRNHAQFFQDPNQEYRVEIRNTSNQLLSTVFSTNPDDPLIREWTERSADLSAFAGQTIRIAFVKQSSSSTLNIHLDNVRITNAIPLATISVTLAPGQIASDINFGNRIVPPAEIHGAKWNDLNGNGQWDKPDEQGLEGWIIYLDANTNGALDFGEEWTTTGADGTYSFTGLAAGDYVVAEVAMAGWTQTYPNEPPTQASRLFAVRGSGTTLRIYELDPTTGAEINSFLAPSTGSGGPHGLAFGPGSLFYIDGNFSPTHTLWELDPDTGAVIDSDVVDAQLPGGIAGLGYLNGKVYVEKSDNNRLLVWDPISDTAVTTLNLAVDVVGGLTGAADLNVLFASNSRGSVFKIDPNTGAALATFSPGVGPLSGGLAYVNGEIIATSSTGPGTAYRINPSTGAVLGNFTLGGSLNVSALAGDGTLLLSATGAHLVTLETSQVVNDINFGNWVAPPGEIHGAKWHDLNGNGVWNQTDEPALAGWIIFLDSNTNGALDIGETWTVTGPDGRYSFTGLPAGEYVVAELQQSGWTRTYPNEVHAGSERLFTVRALGNFQTIYELNPATGAFINSFAAPTTGFAGSQGLAVAPRSLFFIDGTSTTTHTLWELDLDTGAVIDSDIIDSTLVGRIGGLGYVDGKVYVEKQDLNRILVWDPVSDTHVATLSIAADIFGGLTGAADLGVLFDVTGNGNIVTIDPHSGTILATLTPGVGSFSGLAYIQGELIAARTGSGGAAFRIDPDTGQVIGPFALGGTGTVGGLGADGATRIRGAHVVELVAGQAVTDVNFGNWIAPPAQIHGAKWNDLDGDGIWDRPDEPALEGWTVFLDANGNGKLNDGEASSVTGADGSYSFTGLAAGHYIVAEVMQPGWFQTLTPRFITLDAGENAADVNFGNQALPGSIRGQKWNDLDGDGVKEDGEPGLPGWIVFIDANDNGLLDDGEISTTSDADGNYELVDLTPGQYRVAEVQQAGWQPSGGASSHVVTVGPGQNVMNVDFGNMALAPLTGDYTRNGVVNAADYIIWRKTLGADVAPYSGADGNADGHIGQEDFDIWQAHFGQTLVSPEARNDETPSDDQPAMGSLIETVVPSSEPAESREQHASQSPATAVAMVDGMFDALASGSLINVPGLFVQEVRENAVGSSPEEGRNANTDPRSSEARQDAALMAWLMQASDRDSAIGEINGSGRSRDSYFDSWDGARAGVGESFARVKRLTRRVAELKARR